MIGTETWAERFALALRTSSDGFPSRTVDDVLRDDVLSDHNPTGLEVARVALEEMASLVLAREIIPGYFERTWSCESPIEDAMYWALCVEGLRRCDTVITRLGNATNGADVRAPDTLWIEPQADIGKYRADFRLTFRSRWSFEEYADIEAVVECDGHDFHERTKQQARHDRSRDRALQELGFRVLRFTGSEIWADALRCAREAIQHLERVACDGRRKTRQ